MLYHSNRIKKIAKWVSLEEWSVSGPLRQPVQISSYSLPRLEFSTSINSTSNIVALYLSFRPCVANQQDQEWPVRNYCVLLLSFDFSLRS